MRMEFLGAAHEVTGSQTLLTVNDRPFLVDCGMEQGANRFENKPLPVRPERCSASSSRTPTSTIPATCRCSTSAASAAPSTPRRRPATFCRSCCATAPTYRSRTRSGRTRKAQRRRRSSVEPVYDLEDAEGALSLLRPCRYGERLPVLEGVEIRFTDVGHLLGSAAIELWLREGDAERKVVFSGDVGNTNQPLLREPAARGKRRCAYHRIHLRRPPPRKGAPSTTPAPSPKCCSARSTRGGNVVIPSFAVGRTQEMLYFLRQIKLENLVHGHGDFPVYVDSPSPTRPRRSFCS